MNIEAFRYPVPRPPTTGEVETFFQIKSLDIIVLYSLLNLVDLEALLNEVQSTVSVNSVVMTQILDETVRRLPLKGAQFVETVLRPRLEIMQKKKIA